MKKHSDLPYLFPILISFIIIGCGQRSGSEKTSNNMSTDSLQSSHEKQTAPPMQSGYSDVNGIKMYYEIHGSGRPLVLIHGGGSTIQTTFGRLLPVLARNRKIIAVELQAHGHTGDRNAPLSFGQDAADVVALLKNLNIDSADFFGFSNGGQTAMQIAITYPRVVKKLIIASAFYKRSAVPDAFWTGMNHAKFSDMPQELKDDFLRIHPGNEAALMNMFHRDVKRMQTFTDWSDADLRSIAAPTLLVIGDADVAGPEHAAEMYRLIPHSHLAIIPGGHGRYLGEISTLQNGKWETEYLTPMFEQFLDAPSSL